jgi:hypothetical protein
MFRPDQAKCCVSWESNGSAIFENSYVFNVIPKAYTPQYTTHSWNGLVMPNKEVDVNCRWTSNISIYSIKWNRKSPWILWSAHLQLWPDAPVL